MNITRENGNHIRSELRKHRKRREQQKGVREEKQMQTGKCKPPKEEREGEESQGRHDAERVTHSTKSRRKERRMTRIGSGPKTSGQRT